jgi:hypothetical protein
MTNNKKIWCGMGIEINPTLESSISGIEIKGYSISNILDLNKKGENKK